MAPRSTSWPGRCRDRGVSRHDTRTGRRQHPGTHRHHVHAPRRCRDADVHARGHQRHGQGARPRRPARGRRQHHPVQHVPPVAAAGTRAHRPPGRPAPVHGLGRRHPHRLGRLPGGQPGRPAPDRRGWRDLPFAPRRVDPALHARARHRGPGGARLGHRGRASTSRCRRMPPAAQRCSRPPSAPTAGPSAASGRTSAPTRRCSASSRAAWSPTCAPSRRGPSRRCPSTACASAASPVTRRRHSAARRSTSSCRCSRTIRGRAT